MQGRLLTFGSGSRWQGSMQHGFAGPEDGTIVLHVEHGVPLAVNAGDALAAPATAALIRAARAVPPPVAGAALDGWEPMTLETIEGQALDLGGRELLLAATAYVLDHSGLALRPESGS